MKDIGKFFLVMVIAGFLSALWQGLVPLIILGVAIVLIISASENFQDAIIKFGKFILFLIALGIILYLKIELYYWWFYG